MVRYPHLLGPKVGMVSAVTLRVNRQVLDFPGATILLHSDRKNLQEPPPREYSPEPPLQLVLPPPQPLLEYHIFDLSRD